MPIYHAIGDALVSEKEMKEKIALGDIEKFKIAISSAVLTKRKKEPAPLDFSTGRATALDFKPFYISPKRKKLQKFENIDIGKPLSVMIRHVYNGKYGGKWPDMLVTSAMKSIATYNAMPRAVNFLVKNISKKRHLSNVSATEEGTPLVFYTPALLDENTDITFEIILDRIPGEIFDNISKAFTTAAGIPIFASQATGLLAAGIVTKIVKKILNMIFDGKPVLKVKEPMYFNLAGAPFMEPGFKLVTEEKVDKEIRKEYKVNEEGKLVHKDNPEKEYEEEYPYLIISLDGREYKKYERFIPTAASAVMLEKFYNIKEGQESIEPLIEAITLYNDIQNKNSADKALSELKGLTPGTEEYEQKETLYKAYVANILSEEIKKIVQR